VCASLAHQSILVSRIFASDDDSDDEDLWAGLDDDSAAAQLNVSANLLNTCGQTENVVHKGESDEGRLTWVAPTK
jgi:hypothetical protein